MFRSGEPERPRFRFDAFDQQSLERACYAVTARNKNTADRSTFFVGITADENGSGHALIEVKPDGTFRRHWGPVSRHLQTLQNA